MKFQTVCAALLVGAAGSALAVGPGSLGTIDNVPTVIGNSVGPGSFADVYSFVLGSPGQLSGGVNDISVPPQLNITAASFAVELRRGTTLIGTDPTPGNFSFSSLSAGAYSLTVVGNAVGSMGGLYAGGLLAQPVPEPESYALMLAGAAVVGFIATRRRRG
jgi:hypothetical protein